MDWFIVGFFAGLLVSAAVWEWLLRPAWRKEAATSDRGTRDLEATLKLEREIGAALLIEQGEFKKEIAARDRRIAELLDTAGQCCEGKDVRLQDLAARLESSTAVNNETMRKLAIVRDLLKHVLTNELGGA